jgi:hypothetical protein
MARAFFGAFDFPFDSRFFEDTPLDRLPLVVLSTPLSYCQIRDVAAGPYQTGSGRRRGNHHRRQHRHIVQIGWRWQECTPCS